MFSVLPFCVLSISVFHFSIACLLRLLSQHSLDLGSGPGARGGRLVCAGCRATHPRRGFLLFPDSTPAPSESDVLPLLRRHCLTRFPTHDAQTACFKDPNSSGENDRSARLTGQDFLTEVEQETILDRNGEVREPFTREHRSISRNFRRKG